MLVVVAVAVAVVAVVVVGVVVVVIIVMVVAVFVVVTLVPVVVRLLVDEIAANQGYDSRYQSHACGLYRLTRPCLQI